jgi:hypothetical protein
MEPALLVDDPDRFSRELARFVDETSLRRG